MCIFDLTITYAVLTPHWPVQFQPHIDLCSMNHKLTFSVWTSHWLEQFEAHIDLCSLNLILTCAVWTWHWLVQFEPHIDLSSLNLTLTFAILMNKTRSSFRSRGEMWVKRSCRLHRHPLLCWLQRARPPQCFPTHGSWLFIIDVKEAGRSVTEQFILFIRFYVYIRPSLCFLNNCFSGPSTDLRCSGASDGPLRFKYKTREVVTIEPTYYAHGYCMFEMKKWFDT